MFDRTRLPFVALDVVCVLLGRSAGRGGGAGGRPRGVALRSLPARHRANRMLASRSPRRQVPPRRGSVSSLRLGCARLPLPPLPAVPSPLSLPLAFPSPSPPPRGDGGAALSRPWPGGIWSLPPPARRGRGLGRGESRGRELLPLIH